MWTTTRDKESLNLPVWFPLNNLRQWRPLSGGVGPFAPADTTRSKDDSVGQSISNQNENERNNNGNKTER